MFGRYAQKTLSHLFVVAGYTQVIEGQAQMIELLLLVFCADMHGVAGYGAGDRTIISQRQPGMIDDLFFTGTVAKAGTMAADAERVEVSFHSPFGGAEDKPAAQFFRLSLVTERTVRRSRVRTGAIRGPSF